MVKRLVGIDTDDNLLPEPVRANLASASAFAALSATVAQSVKVTEYNATYGLCRIGGGSYIGHTAQYKILSWVGGVQDTANQLGPIQSTVVPKGTGDVWMERRGQTVTMWSSSGLSNGLGSTATGLRKLLTSPLPTGWRIGDGTIGIAAGVDYNQKLDGVYMSASGLFLVYRAVGDVANWTVQWNTRDAWPTEHLTSVWSGTPFVL